MPVTNYKPPYNINIFTSLLVCTAVAIALCVFRASLAQSYGYLYFIWNLFLAWIPLLLALYLHKLDETQAPKPVWLFFLLIWLVFYPNSSYLVTDFVHLNPNIPIPLWFDILVLFSLAWVGLLLGYLSLWILHQLIAKQYGTVYGWGFVILTNALAGFGVYLGRFFRWNTWDIVTNPKTLFREVVEIVFLSTGYEAYKFTIFFATILTVLYFTVYPFLTNRNENG